MMPATEILLAIVGIFGTIASGGLVYAIRKWADAKEKQSIHDAQMTMKKLEHELEVEKRREERDNIRLDRELETAKYIQTNTEVLRSLKEAIERELGDSGVRAVVGSNANSITANTACILEMSSGLKEILSTVKNIQSQVSNQGS
jgi:hypothetical protein